ncbi:MAG: Rrf2 family transcriptional regulator [Coriobacteriales bacterium]|nr:Rrf2 family transcriptional regulator [Coriobacteriales bacterium]
MRITRRTDYAIHLIADLAETPDKPLGLRILAERHNVTYAYARTVQQGLQKAGIVTTVRGVNGGIKLAKGLDEITLLDVFEAAQNPLDVAFDPTGTPWENYEGACDTDHVWNSTKKILNDHLSSMTMHHVVHGKAKVK